MIPQEHALALDLDPFKIKRKIEIATANGKVLVPMITIPIFECFGAVIKNMDVICHNLPVGSAAEGLLGLDFLKKSATVIDFSKNVIQIP